MVPPSPLGAEAGEGFQDSKLLAHKFVELFYMCKELLSKQYHYDWGLRAVKSVLRVAGMLKRAEPQLQEDGLVIRNLQKSDYTAGQAPRAGSSGRVGHSD